MPIQSTHYDSVGWVQWFKADIDLSLRVSNMFDCCDLLSCLHPACCWTWCHFTGQLLQRSPFFSKLDLVVGHDCLGYAKGAGKSRGWHFARGVGNLLAIYLFCLGGWTQRWDNRCSNGAWVILLVIMDRLCCIVGGTCDDCQRDLTAAVSTREHGLSDESA